MKKILLVIASLLVLAHDPLPCQEESVRNYPCAAQSLINGRSHILEVSIEELEGSPAWSLESEDEPPVSIGEAIREAIAEFNQYMTDEDAWIFDHIALHKICRTWVYRAQWRRKDFRESGVVTVPVLMSGKAVPLDGLEPPVGSPCR